MDVRDGDARVRRGDWAVAGAIVAALLAEVLVIVPGAQAASAMMTVDWVRDEEHNYEWYAGSPRGTGAVDTLNSTATSPYLEVDQWSDEWWEARFTDPNPGTVPDGGFLISVIVAVRYRMPDSDWLGTLTLEARTSAGVLGSTTLPEHYWTTEETWDVTALLNAEADPLAALNDLSIRMINDDPSRQQKVNWSYAKTDVVFGGPPVELAFTVGPGDTVAGQAFAPELEVVVRDVYGNTVPYATDDVTLAIGSNPVGGTLSGTTTVAAVGGVATFPGLSIEKAAVGYTLEATSGTLVSATSATFAVTPGTPTGLDFIAEPSSVQMGNAIAPPVRVAIVDSYGNTVTGASGIVDIAILSDPGGGTLSGTTSVGTVNGVASFTDLSIDLEGDGYTLEATSGGLGSAASAAFNVVSDPLTVMTVNWVRDNKNSLEYYSGSPSGTAPLGYLNSPLGSDYVEVEPNSGEWWEARFTDPYPAIVPAGGFLVSVVVTVQYRMADPGWDGTLALEARTSTTLLGSTTVPEYGSATQETWDVTVLLNAETDPLAALNDLAVRMLNDAPSASKKVEWSHTKVEVVYGGPPQKMVFETEPADGTIWTVFAPAIRVAVQDVYGNTVPYAADSVSVVIATNPGGGTLSGTTTVAASGGVATFDDLSIDEPGSGYALVAWAPGLVSAMTGSFGLTVPVPWAFDLVSPIDGEPYASSTPTLEWAPSDFAETYALLVAEDASFFSVVIDEASLTGTTHAVPAGVLQPETEYFWRITASNDTGDTAASNNDFSFTTRPRCALEVAPGEVGFHARPGSRELVRREVVVTNSGPVGSVAEVTVAWAVAPACSIAVSEASFSLAAGESRVVTLALDPSSTPPEQHTEASLDVSAKEAAALTDPVLVTVDLEPYGVAGIGCAGAERDGREAEGQSASLVLLALILTAARSLLASRRSADARNA